MAMMMKMRMRMRMERAGCGWRVVPLVQFNNKYLFVFFTFLFLLLLFSFSFFRYHFCGWMAEQGDKAIESLIRNTEPITTAPPIFKNPCTYTY